MLLIVLMQHPPRIQTHDDTRNSPAVGLLRITPAMLSLRLYQRRVCMKDIASLDSF